MNFHQCRARGCATQVPETQPTCSQCWNRIAPDLRQNVETARCESERDGGMGSYARHAMAIRMAIKSIPQEAN